MNDDTGFFTKTVSCPIVDFVVTSDIPKEGVPLNENSINKSLYFEVVLETKRGHSLYITNSRLLLEELWQVLSPFLMTPQTPRLMLFWTGYGLKRNRILYFGETLYSIAILIADQVSPIGLITKVSNMFPY